MKSICVVMLMLIFCGCTEVKPWQKGDLARSHMAFEPDAANSQFTKHVYQSKEGASGGYGISAGGCGCN